MKGIVTLPVRSADTRWGHIQLAVGEDWVRKPDANLLQSVSLGFVDCDREGDSHGELNAAPLEGVFLLLGSQTDPRDGHCSVRTGDRILQATVHHPLVFGDVVEDQPSAVAHASAGVDVAYQHQGYTLLEFNAVLRQASRLQTVAVLH